MLELVAELVHGWRMPWSALAFGITAGILAYFVIRVLSWLVLYGSFLIVSIIRKLKLSPPSPVYWFENSVNKLREGALFYLMIWFAVLAVWLGLFHQRNSLENKALLQIERKMTSIATSWVSILPSADRTDTALFDRSMKPFQYTKYVSTQRTGVRVRSEPRTNAHVISVLPVGKRFKALGSVRSNPPNKDWLQIKLTNGKLGFVHASMVTFE